MCNSMSLHPPFVCASKHHTRFPKQFSDEGGRSLLRMLIIWISLDGLGDPYFDFDTLVAHLQISADTASTRVGFSTLALVALALRVAIFDASNTFLLVALFSTTKYVAGGVGLISFVFAVPELNPRGPLCSRIQSLLYEACGRTMNPVDGVVGFYRVESGDSVRGWFSGAFGGEQYRRIYGEGKPKNIQPEGRNRRVVQDIGNLVAKRAVEGKPHHAKSISLSLCLLQSLSVLHLVFWEEDDLEDNPGITSFLPYKNSFLGIPRKFICAALGSGEAVPPEFRAASRLPPRRDTDSPLPHAQRSQRLKASLSETLTLFYPLAGKIKDDVSIDCNDDGVDFFEARVYCRLSDVLKQPEQKMVRRFLPQEIQSRQRTGNLVVVQATLFECGGMALGVGISHRLADASTTSMFIHGYSKYKSDTI
ncbi:hypothetical protein FH972_005304 [Carpinus fangiana]|uniref:Uncharacterized protein n=1 Tax=Carpinus fangiana TaxID=176857 RepID=A0A5N6QNW4_9ROSI|nr:hypothetical protein FH972_005304 [Carpinus fangiana]